MLKENILHIDETYVRVLKEQNVSENSRQYMWVYRTGKHCKRQIVIYEYNKSRSGDVPEKFLGDYAGYAHTDGYAGYNKLTKVTHCNCWAHLRRRSTVRIRSSAPLKSPEFTYFRTFLILYQFFWVLKYINIL